MKYPLRWGPFFSPDDTGGKGGDGDASGKGGKGDGAPKGSAGDDKQFSQADVDRIVGKVKSDVEGKFSDYPEIKKKLGELSAAADKAQQDRLAGEGKYTEALDTMTKRHSEERDTLTRDRDAWRTKFEGLAVDNAILALCAPDKFDAIDPQDVLALVKNQVKLGADGVPSFADGKSLPDGLKNFLSTRPHLIRSKSRAGSGQNHRGGESGTHIGTGRVGDRTVEEVRELAATGQLRQTLRASVDHPWIRPPKQKDA